MFDMVEEQVIAADLEIQASPYTMQPHCTGIGGE